jgi:signal transduction histidine kinase
MISRELLRRVLAGQALMTLLAGVAVATAPRFLLLVDGESGRDASLLLASAVLVGGSLSALQIVGVVRSRRRLLRQLEVRDRTLDQIQLPKMNDDPWLIVNGWVLVTTLAVVISVLLLRPASIPPAAAPTLGLFSSIIVAGLSLPLLVLVRAQFVRLMERVPPDVMADIVDAQVRSGRLRGRTSRRLISAILTPVAFLAIGSALIAGAHVRDSGASATLDTAVLAARLALAEPDAPSDLAIAALAGHGFEVAGTDERLESRVVAREGLVTVTAPLDAGGFELEYLQRTEWPIDLTTIVLLVLVVALAGIVGLSLGRLLSRDLRMANRGVLTLGTDAALEGTRVMRPARFRVVIELGEAIELLANRFRLFAQAQERSIDARASATRSRGRFFASVSHDLKSPLNAILGFAELCQREPELNQHQRESLDLIVKRGRELLALIETILDAARVEAGQLRLELGEVQAIDLLEAAVGKARELSVTDDTMVTMEVPPDVPPLVVDELRMSQALATLVGHALRTAERGNLRILVDAEEKSATPSLRRRKVAVHIEVPSTSFSAQELEAMLSPERHPGQHRGVALALRLSKAIIELHGGALKVVGRTVSEPAFAVELRGRAGR